MKQEIIKFIDALKYQGVQIPIKTEELPKLILAYEDVLRQFPLRIVVWAFNKIKNDPNLRILPSANEVKNICQEQIKLERNEYKPLSRGKGMTAAEFIRKHPEKYKNGAMRNPTTRALRLRYLNEKRKKIEDGYEFLEDENDCIFAVNKIEDIIFEIELLSEKEEEKVESK